MEKNRVLSKDVLKISLARFFAFGIMLVIPVVLTRYLTQEDYGSYRQLILLFTTLQPFFLFGIPASLRYFMPRAEEKDASVFVSHALLFIFFSGILLFLILSFTGGFLTSLLYNNDLSEYMLLLGLHAFLFLGSSFIGILMIVNDDVNLSAVVAVLFGVLDIIFMCGTVIIYQDITGLLIGIITAGSIKYLVVVAYVLRNFDLKGKLIDKPKFKVQLAYSFPIGLAAILGVINVNIDKYFISFYLDPEAFAVYSIGAYLTPIVLVVQRSVTDIIIPRMSKMHKQNKLKDMRELWHESIRKFGLIIFPITGFLLIAAHDVITIFFPASYGQAASVLSIYLFLLPIGITSYAAIFMSTGKTDIIFKLTVVTLIINFIANLTFIELFGELGLEIIYAPPTATIIITYIVSFFYIYKIRDELKVDLKSVFPWLILFKLVCVTIACCALTILIYFILSDIIPALRVLIVGIGFLAIYAVLIKTLRIFREDDWKLIKSLFS